MNNSEGPDDSSWEDEALRCDGYFDDYFLHIEVKQLPPLTICKVEYSLSFKVKSKIILLKVYVHLRR